MIKKIFKAFLFIILFAIGALLLFVLVSVLPIDRYDYHESPFYHTMNDRLDSLKKVKSITKGSTFLIGYSKVNLTPDHRISLAGYGNRKGALYSSIHDSIYVRTMVISNKNTRVAIVSADLLIIPPTVTAVLEKELPSIGFSLNNTYLNAVHTHNSIGNWGKGVVGFMYGSYDDSIVHFIADKIKASILLASKNAIPSTIKTAHIPVKGPVRNRIKDGGGVDSILHVVEVHREDSSKLIVMSYTAHATCLYSRDWELSRDYPGVLVDTLEKRGYAFAMFMAGAVGSHGPTQSGWAGTEWMSSAIVSKFEKQKSTLTSLRDSSLVMYRIPLELGKAQVKISEDWKVRPWLFRAAFGYSPNYLTVLRIGELVLIGTPCDYSGELTSELYAAAQKKNLQVMVTSFNGGYIGYITPLKYYDIDHYESRLMNWYGPGSGEYMQGCLLGLLDVVSN